MKEWAITLLAIVGSYAVYQWLTGQQNASDGQRASANAGAFNLTLGPLAVAAGINSGVDPTASGVPSFDQTAYANGHGDQVWAAYHTNPSATMTGSPVYSPAFGPNENQPTPSEQGIGV